MPYTNLTGSTLCSRCGCYYADHAAEEPHPCRYCIAGSGVRPCKAFTPNTNFTVFLKWAKNWVKAKPNRNINQLRKIWTKIQDISHCHYCVQCHSAVIAISSLTKHQVKRHQGLICPVCLSCATCCDCVDCGGCHHKRQRRAICQSCHMCTGRCCHCRNCVNCNARCDDDYCGKCELCNTCCQCSDQKRVPFYTSFNRKPKFYKPTLKHHIYNPTSRYIAAEIEVARILGNGRPIYDMVKEWGGAIVRDGSLPAGGFEINTAPAGGDLYVEQINRICNELHKQQAAVTNHCGLHIHVDARDLSYYDLRRLIRVYAEIEKILFAAVSPERAASRYCQPCGQKYLTAIEDGKFPYDKVKSDVIKSVYNVNNTESVRRSKYNNARYTALNLHSWFFRGTIECRMFDGTINAHEIQNWGIFWAMFIDYIIQTDDEVVLKNLESPNQFFTVVQIIKNNEVLLDFFYRRVLQYGNVGVIDQIKQFIKTENK